MVCGLIAAVVLARGSVVKAIGMVILGLLLGLAGTDVNSGIRRFDFGFQGLADGIEFVALSMAIYGIAEVAHNLEQKSKSAVVTSAIGRVWPSGRRHSLLPARDPARNRARLAARRIARRRRADRGLRRLYAGEEGRQAAAQLRPRRHPRRGGAGVRQQRGRADLVHSDADARTARRTPPWR